MMALACEVSINLMLYLVSGLFQSMLWWRWLVKNQRSNFYWLSQNVSIHVMMALAREVYLKALGRSLHRRFQSMLWWRWLVKKEIEKLREEVAWCFNPCYDGVGSWRETNAHLRLWCPSVSIHVMMALAREVQSHSSWLGMAQSFNPCYDGVGSWS